MAGAKCEVLHKFRLKSMRSWQQVLRPVWSMTDPGDAVRCDFCKVGNLVRGNRPLAFRQWTDRGYVVCEVVIPMGVCDRCGSKSWDEAADTIIDAAVRQEYEKLR